jgi:hypothetical protein
MCDLAETCSGSGAACPADTKSTAECRATPEYLAERKPALQRRAEMACTLALGCEWLAFITTNVGRSRFIAPRP